MVATKEDGAAAGPRGRGATHPREVPAAGWKDVLFRVKDEIKRDNASLIAAGVALYALLAAFPALAAALSLYGYFATPEQVVSHVQALVGVLPDQAAEIFRDQLQNVAGKEGSTLGLGALAGLVLALWSARKGMTALMTATNIAYDEEEERGFLKKALLSLGFTLGAVVAFLVVVVLAVAAPVAVESLALHPVLNVLLLALRWALLWLFVVFCLAVIYRYGPDREKPKWRWVTWGSAIATTLWIAGSILFSLYVRNFGSYGETYGTIGGVVVLLMWFYLSGFIVILGAEINSELEHQTAKDSTSGEPRPMGSRDAYVADTLGEARE